ncbi:MAG: KH domain-containing protein [Ruminococcaceae bacterium]|nr:KH domain-containing protein [Oscillospiraceae bacterium]
MKDVLIYIIQSLVEFPDQVTVTESEKDGEIVFEVRVAQSDMGKIIGRQGRIAKAIRTLMKAAASRENARVNVVIAE